MKQNNSEKQLDDAIAQLPTEMAPKKDLWAGIDKAISHGPQQVEKKSNAWQQVTAIAACMCMGLLSYQTFFNQQTSQYEAGLQTMTQTFQQEKQTLLVKYRDQKALADNWQVQLVELEQAEAAIKLALKTEPENATLLRMLSQVYQQQLDLINKVHKPAWQQI